MNLLKPILIFASLLSYLILTGCLTKQTTTTSSGALIEEKYVIKRPVKKFIQNVEVE